MKQEPSFLDQAEAGKEKKMAEQMNAIYDALKDEGDKYFNFPENGAGGTGGFEFEGVNDENEVVITVAPYGCNYNHPKPKNELREFVRKLGFSGVKILKSPDNDASKLDDWEEGLPEKYIFKKPE
jgi:hypothetical protein